jgi:Mn2+/Fe2+ NRAMP family transporter
MRLLSYILFAVATLVGGSAVLIYGFVTSLACGYAPGAASCHAAPWDLGGDDRFWLVGLPGSIVASLIVLALLARRKASRHGRA